MYIEVNIYGAVEQNALYQNTLNSFATWIFRDKNTFKVALDNLQVTVKKSIKEVNT